MKKIYIVGAGGHAKVVGDIILKRKELLNDDIDLMGFFDDNTEKSKQIFGKPILGKLSDLEFYLLEENSFFVIGIGNNNIRKQIVEQVKVKFYTAIHPNAILGAKVNVEEGTVIMAGAIINSYTNIGKHVIINTGSIVEHDVNIGEFVHIAPKTVLCGGVSVGAGAWIGAGSTVIQGVKIGEKSFIGAGSNVLKDISKNKKAYGNPCKEICGI